MVFPVVIYGCESWTTKKAEHWRVYAFELSRRLLRVPWIAKRSNQSTIKEINFEYLLEGLMLKLKLQYFGHLMQRIDSLKKTLMLGKIETGRRTEGNDREWDGWIASPTQWTWVWVSSGSWWWVGKPVPCSPWGHKESDTTEGLNWTELNWCWSWSFNTLATWCKELTHWKRPWCWEKMRERKEGHKDDEMVGWHHRLNGHEFEQTQGDSEGQGSLVCCIPWGRKELDMTEWLNWTELILFTNSYWDLFWEFHYLSQSRNVIWPMGYTVDIFL